MNSRRTVTTVVLALALVLVPVSYVAAADGGNLGVHLVDPIKTDAGWISGTTIDSIYVKGTTQWITYEAMLGEIGKKVRIYRGIPYAAPPVGNLRWKPPQPVTPWEGIRECTKFCPMAPQPWPASSVYDSIPESGMSEDILYLNIQTPAKNANDRLPVMVLFHGGGITTGSVNRVGDNCPPLPQHGVVSVTVQHRIGPFGYLAHPELTAESQNHASGNYGQLDLIAALKWVKKNIAAFGGDPNNITIWGHSGGGSKTLWMLSSPLAKGLFNKAIVEAGCAINDPLDPMSMCESLANAEQSGVNLATKVGASNLAQFRQKTWQEIILAANTKGSGYSSNFTVDGWSLPQSLYNTFKARQQNDVPYMIGAGEGEPLKHRGIQLWADALLSGKSDVYVYLFKHVPINWRPFIKAYHGLEVTYQYGVADTLARIYGTSLLPAKPEIPPDPGVNEEDYSLQDAVMTIWAKFAKTGDPNGTGLVMWPPFNSTPGQDRYFDISVPLQAKPGYMQLFH